MIDPHDIHSKIVEAEENEILPKNHYENLPTSKHGLFTSDQDNPAPGKPRVPRTTVQKVREIATQYSYEAIMTLAEIMMDKDVNKPARITAAMAVLDRAIGKPKEFLEVSRGNPFENMTVSELQDALNQLQYIKAAQALPTIDNDDVPA